MLCTTVTNICSKGKVMYDVTDVVHYQVLLCLDTYNDTDAIAINKLLYVS